MRANVGLEVGTLASSMMAAMDVSTLLSDEAAHRYEQLELIAEGGMGSVFRAWDTKVVRSVILKFPRADKVKEHFTVRRFETEARALAKLDHPNIVRLYDFDDNNGHPFIVTEDVSGVSLRELIEKKSLNTHRAIEIIAKLAKGVEAAHEAKIIHRDIKPENVLVTAEGVPKLIDFGFAMSVDGQDFTRMTKTGNVVGTFLYMAPEVLLGKADASEKSDLYSFGLLAYEVLTGQHPFAGIPIEVICDLSSDIEVMPPSMVCENIGSNIDELMDSLIERDSDRRIGSARAARRRFERWLHRSGIQAEEATRELTAVTARPDERKRKKSAASDGPATVAPTGGRKLLLVCLFFIALVLLTNLVYRKGELRALELAQNRQRVEEAKREARMIELRDWLLAKSPSSKSIEFNELSTLLPKTKVSQRLGQKVRVEPENLAALYFLALSAKKSLPEKDVFNWYCLITDEFAFKGNTFFDETILKEFLKLSEAEAMVPHTVRFIESQVNKWSKERTGKLLLAYLRQIVPPRDYKGDLKKKGLVREQRTRIRMILEKLRTEVSLPLFNSLFFAYIEYMAFTSVDDQPNSILDTLSLVDGLGPKYWESKLRGAEALATLFDPPITYLKKAMSILDKILQEAPKDARDSIDARRAYAKTLIAARIHRSNGDSKGLYEEALKISQEVSLRSKGTKHHREVLIFRILTLSRTLFTSRATRENANLMSRLFELIDSRDIPKEERYRYLYAKAEVLQNRGQFDSAGKTIKEGIACAPYSHKSGMLAIVTYYDIARGINALKGDF